MTIKTEISLKEYSKLLLSLTYKKPIMKIIIAVAILMLGWILCYYLHLFPVPKPKIYQYITLILITIVQPTTIYMTIRRNYYSSNHLREPLEIEINMKAIKIKGESFYTEILWEKAFKIDEQKAWFLIYQNNLSAIIIPKKSFQKDEKEDFIQILSTIKHVPVYLKKE